MTKARMIYIANLVVQSGIIVTGSVVRLTGSGLGCPTWPQCVEGSYTPTQRQEEAFHKYIEFGNRLLTFVVAIVAIATLIDDQLCVKAQKPRTAPKKVIAITSGCSTPRNRGASCIGGNNGLNWVTPCYRVRALPGVHGARGRRRRPRCQKCRS